MKKLLAVVRILGLILFLYSFLQLIPFIVSIFLDDEIAYSFLYTFFVGILLSTITYVFTVDEVKIIEFKEALAITIFSWLVLCLYSAFPFYLSGYKELNFINSLFESTSGLTTTGSTILTDIDSLSNALKLYRQLLQWIGGIGIVILAVAIMPLIGIGGFQLFRSEIPGPVKDTKLSPRISDTAKLLFLIYLILTIMCTIAFYFAGMSVFDAICHAFSTISLGGFSPYDQSIGHFNSPLINIITSVFMIISAGNFALHYIFYKKKTFAYYFKDSEYKFLLSVILISCILVVLVSMLKLDIREADEIIKLIFQTISLITTTGFIIDDFSLWPSFIPFFIFFLGFIGGCNGSTGGGIKVFRIILLIKQINFEINRNLHPSCIFSIKFGNKSIDSKIIDSIWSYFSLYISIFFVSTLILTGFDLDFITAFSAVSATLNNIGPGLGAVSLTFAYLGDWVKGILCLLMILGRLEILTVFLFIFAILRT